MNQRYLLSAMLLGLLSFGTNAKTTVSANEKPHYETRICRGCDYNSAVVTAKTVEPVKSCTDLGDSPYAEAVQACYAKPFNILVINADNRNMWRFEKTYDNDGNLSDNANYYSTIPAEVIELANQLLDTYEAMHKATAQVSAKWNAGEYDYDRSNQNKLNSCEDYGFSEALDDAFSGRLKKELQLQMKKDMQSDPNLRGPKKKRIIRKYGPDDINRVTQVAFFATMTNDGLEFVLNENYTYFDGLGLDTFKEQWVSAEIVNECFTQALDAKYPKTVAGSGNSKPSFDNIPLVYAGKQIDSCKHNYYINGVETLLFEGKCP